MAQVKRKTNKRMAKANRKKNTRKNSSFLRRRSFSTKQLLLFVLVFGAIGGFLVYRSFAATIQLASSQAELMALPSGAVVITDSNASGGKAVRMSNNVSITGNFS